MLEGTWGDEENVDFNLPHPLIWLLTVELFENQTKLVWVVNPLQETVLVHHSLQPDKLLLPGDNLDGEEIVPGFSLVVAELFAEWEF